MSYLKRAKWQKKKRTTRDILDQLRKIMSSGPEEEDDLPDISLTPPKQISELQVTGSGASTKQNHEEAAKMLKPISNSLIFLSQSNLSEAACASFYAIIGCTPCVEQWIETSTSNSKCPLCCTSQITALFPWCVKLPIYWDSQSPGERAAGNEGSDTDTIPYGRGNDVDHSDEDFDPAPAF